MWFLNQDTWDKMFFFLDHDHCACASQFIVSAGGRCLPLGFKQPVLYVHRPAPGRRMQSGAFEKLAMRWTWHATIPSAKSDESHKQYRHYGWHCHNGTWLAVTAYMEILFPLLIVDMGRHWAPLVVSQSLASLPFIFQTSTEHKERAIPWTVCPRYCCCSSLSLAMVPVTSIVQEGAW